MKRSFAQKHPETGEQLHGENWTTCQCDYHDGVRGCISGNRVVMMRLRQSLSNYDAEERRRHGLDDDE